MTFYPDSPGVPIFFLDLKIFYISAAQAVAVVNAAGVNIGQVGPDGDEIERKHQPGNMLPPQHGHTPQGHNQPSHLLQTHEQVSLIDKTYLKD